MRGYSFSFNWKIPHRLTSTFPVFISQKKSKSIYTLTIPKTRNTSNACFEVMAELENPNLITFLSSLLEEVAESNDVNCGFKAPKISVFHGLTRPTISIQSYLDRIYKYANCSPSCFIVAYVYLDRFAQRQPSLPINSLNVHRLLITSVMVAAKFMDDM